MLSNVICPHFPKCNACSDWTTAYSVQLDRKRSNLVQLLDACELQFNGPISVLSAGEYSLRHRADFSMQRVPGLNKLQMGFFDSERNLMDIPQCLQFAPTLDEVYRKFRETLLPEFPQEVFRKASVRLRVGPSGERGCWLDLSNLDIKYLLEQPEYVARLIEQNLHLEMGQKGKTPELINERFKLSAPFRRPWFKIESKKVKANLSCLISEFTQPSWSTASLINQIVEDWLDQIGHLDKITEFGAGIGQFTMQFLLLGKRVTALESDRSACESLILNARHHNVQNELIVHEGDFHRLPYRGESDLVFVNPSRAGLRGFTASLAGTGAKNAIYVSCFPESMLEDLRALKAHYRIADLKIVDQFPQTSHYEVCALLERT